MSTFWQRVKGVFSRRFEGAQVDRTTSDWILSPIRTNDDIRANLPMLVMRSRDLAKNNSDYRKWLSLRKKNIIGPQGIVLQAQVRNNPDSKGQITQDKVANAEIESQWKAWGKKRNGGITPDGRHSWKSFTELVDRTFAVDGECFIRILRGAKNRWGISFQIVDSTRFDVSYNVAPAGPNTNSIVMGIELTPWNEPVAYYTTTSANGMYTQRRQRIPAADMIHFFKQEFVGQVRGFPKACAAILNMNMSAAYLEAELIAARVAACQMGVWERPANSSGRIRTDSKDEEKATMDMEPGKFTIAPRGWTMKSVTPNHPGSQAGSFLKTVGRKTSNGLDVAYNEFANDLESVNFSSMRSGTLSERDGWKMDQSTFIEFFCDLIWGVWLEQFLLAGNTFLPFSKLEKFDSIVFTTRRWDWVDPLRDIKADAEAIALKVLSPQDVIREKGRNPEEVLEELALWEERLKVYGLNVSVAVAPAAAPAAPAAKALPNAKTDTKVKTTGE